ncbi:MAG TPA: helix-turn-helix domain-containing protein, partial [Fibrobacteria bacterium]|nr:helix-turn-helix domain-containing protein [Fibrobacteria bacterium]
ILCLGHQITPEDLPDELSSAGDSEGQVHIGKGMTLEEIEMMVIQSTLRRNHGDKQKTADELGISLRTIYRKLEMVTAGQEPISHSRRGELS